MMCLFAEAIVNIPYIISLNIADNNLTDRGLGPIVKAIVSMKDLIDLNLSYNTIGTCVAAGNALVALWMPGMAIFDITVA